MISRRLMRAALANHGRRVLPVVKSSAALVLARRWQPGQESGIFPSGRMSIPQRACSSSCCEILMCLKSAMPESKTVANYASAATPFVAGFGIYFAYKSLDKSSKATNYRDHLLGLRIEYRDLEIACFEIVRKNFEPLTKSEASSAVIEKLCSLRLRLAFLRDSLTFKNANVKGAHQAKEFKDAIDTMKKDTAYLIEVLEDLMKKNVNVQASDFKNYLQPDPSRICSLVYSFKGLFKGCLTWCSKEPPVKKRFLEAMVESSLNTKMADLSKGENSHQSDTQSSAAPTTGPKS